MFLKKNIFFLFFLFGFLTMSGSVHALGAGDCSAQNPNIGVYQGVCVPKGSFLNLSELTPLAIFTKVLNWLLVIGGFIGVIAFAISGIQYLVSAGDDKILEVAKRNMIFSVVGVLVMLSGLIIVTAIDTWLKGSKATF